MYNPRFRMYNPRFHAYNPTFWLGIASQISMYNRKVHITMSYQYCGLRGFQWAYYLLCWKTCRWMDDVKWTSNPFKFEPPGNWLGVLNSRGFWQKVCLIWWWSIEREPTIPRVLAVFPSVFTSHLRCTAKPFHSRTRFRAFRALPPS